MRTPRLELDHGGYPRSDDRLKDAALHLAVKRDSLDSIRFHLELDADVHSVNQVRFPTAWHREEEERPFFLERRNTFARGSDEW